MRRRSCSEPNRWLQCWRMAKQGSSRENLMVERQILVCFNIPHCFIQIFCVYPVLNEVCVLICD